MTGAIPYFVEPPALTPALVEEITQIIFGEPVKPEPCDIIFIFGGSYPGLWERGAEAYFKGLGSPIIATGGHKPTALRHHAWRDGVTPEAEVIRRELIRLGVPEGKILFENRSTNTYENVTFAREVYDFSGVSSILAVCKSLAVGRQTRTLKAQVAPNVRVIPYTFDVQPNPDGPTITRTNWMEFPESRQFIFANVLKIHQYGRARHLVPLENVSAALRALIREYFEG